MEVSEDLKLRVLLSIFTEGFQTSDNSHYDSWPISALVPNLHPRTRFLMRKVVPPGFFKVPKEPKRLDTFLILIIDELNSINNKRGRQLVFRAGQTRSVYVHVLLFSADLRTMATISGTTGASGNFPCRFCDLEGTFLPSSNWFYSPSTIRGQLN